MNDREYIPGPVTAAVVLGSSLFLIGQVLITLIVVPLIVISIVLPYRWRFSLVLLWVRFNQWWLATTCGLRHEVEGIENIPADPTVILSKHQSAWETLTLQLYFAPQVWVLKRELFWLPVFGWGLAAMRPIAIDRGAGKEAMDQVVSQGKQRLGDRIWVVIFPEGTRVAPGAKRRYKLGGATLAASAGVPVLPVAHNSGDFWPRKSFIKRPGVIRLVIGEPIAGAGRSPAEINRRAEEWIEATVARLRAPYAGTAGAAVQPGSASDPAAPATTD